MVGDADREFEHGAAGDASLELPGAGGEPHLPAAALQALLLELHRRDHASALPRVDALLAVAGPTQAAILRAAKLTLQRLNSQSLGGRRDDMKVVTEALRAVENVEAGECAALRDWMFSVVGVRIGTLGAVETGLRWLDRAIHGSRHRGDLVQCRHSLSHKGVVLMLAGALDQAAAVNLEALSLLAGDDEDRPTLLNNTASACVLRARQLPVEDGTQRRALGEQALALAQEALALAGALGLHGYAGWITANVGHALRVLGRMDEARHAYDQILASCDHCVDRADVLVNLAALAADEGMPAQAESWLEQAQLLVSEDLLAPSYDLYLETQVRVKAMAGRHAEALEWSERRRQRMQQRYDMRMHHMLSDELLRDLETARRAEQEAHARARALDAASLAKNRFLAHVSHELRTPIHAILGLAQLMQARVLGPALDEKVQGILEAGQSLLHIVNDILDLSKIEAGQMPLDHAPMSMPELLQRVERLLRPGAEAKGLALQVQADAALDAPLLADAPRLEQVLVNLVGNAIKFTGHGGVSLRATVAEARHGSVRLRLEVQDTGVGIPPAALALLFQPFVQVDARITRQYGGTGLGLAISRRLVELMGGTIGAVSDVGMGSTFWCEIPLQLAEQPPAPPQAVPPPPPAVRGPRLRGLRVLAADDNRLNRLVIQRQLQREGARVQLAEDGLQALGVLRAQPGAFDVVLMDVQMPTLDGLSATRALRADPALAHLPVIGLSAGVLAQDQDAALAAGMNRFVAKPVDLERLVEALHPCLPRS